MSQPGSAAARPVQHYVETGEDVERALEHLLVLGQAQGILMERLGLTPAPAFAFPNRASQQTDTKIHVVARGAGPHTRPSRTILPARVVPGPLAGD